MRLAFGAVGGKSGELGGHGLARRNGRTSGGGVCGGGGLTEKAPLDIRTTRFRERGKTWLLPDKEWCNIPERVVEDVMQHMEIVLSQDTELTAEG